MSQCSIKQNVGGLERLGCLAAGGWFLGKGLLTRRTASTVMGGLLIYRGLSGHCKAYAALGLDTRTPSEKAES